MRNQPIFYLKDRWLFTPNEVLVGEPDPKFGKVQGRRGTEGLKTDSYVKIPDGSESGLRLWP